MLLGKLIWKFVQNAKKKESNNKKETARHHLRRSDPESYPAHMQLYKNVIMYHVAAKYDAVCVYIIAILSYYYWTLSILFSQRRPKVRIYTIILCTIYKWLI
jgi:hypothetical protein